MRSKLLPALLLLTTALAATAGQPPQASGDPNYAGSASCAGCHSEQYQAWRGSHHDQAMQHASAATVLADFDNSTFEHYAGRYRFYRDGEQFMVSFTPAEGGEAEQFQVLYTFGVEPLQQYLLPSAGGRLQALPIAWDTLQGQWFDVQGDLQPEPHERIHWRNGGLNWNSMCADCHSTGLEKNYQPTSDSYATQWAELNVGCESCHGPAADHANWQPNATSLRPLPSGQAALTGDQATSCGQCHARRGPLLAANGAEATATARFSEMHYALEVAAPPLYHADGQINDEVFVLGSYLQSKMHSAGITCSNCHDPHSNQLNQPGNALCLNCHEADYNLPSHHRHAPYTPAQSGHPRDYSGTLGNGQLLPEQSLGNQCVDCHMPGKVYMGNDFRRDHSFRVPRPDLAAQYPQLQLPNACGSCHRDRDASWAAAAIADWHGPVRDSHFAEALLAAQAGGDQRPLYALIAVTGGYNQAPPIARATAVQLAAPATLGSELEALLRQQLNSDQPLLRRTGIAALSHLPADYRLRVLAPLLDDSHAAVRLQLAQALSDITVSQLPTADQATFTELQREYRRHLKANSDFPSLRYQAGVDAHRRGELEQAAADYRAALALDDRFNPARYNLAQLYYQRGDRDGATALYRTIVAQEPRAGAARHALGLLLGELGDSAGAIDQLLAAAALNGSGRSWYNAAILQQRSGDASAAQHSYQQALASEPDNRDYLAGLVSLLVQNNRRDEALAAVRAAIARNPYSRELLQLRHQLQQR
ncbi:tetratricopeptide repeat protein [Gammaproteobacteria bacterium LSUCC0057]|uniref:Tetratricopeptide repeat protein n=1 Tax=Gammaproteobacteria bacterium LSUCC0057 TaxID=2559237 RepID=A0A4Y8UJ68_9GAMM|nr:tetratricopeptide repeat protein [Gammaproteobacteria bacterium LSUCC0057]